MTERDLIELSFRYRTKPGSKDAPLFRYLKKLKPTERKQMILKALRACYLIEAVKADEELDKVDKRKLVRHLEKVYFDETLVLNGEGVEAYLNVSVRD
ncbi:MAG TPA: hypothetical protein VK211_21690 [Kamptonema sp.]|nr:hypothetical protein [Kamptonema sp.]